MTAQSSKNRLLNYYLYRLGRLKYLSMLLLLFSFITFPLYAVFIEGYAAETLTMQNIGNTYQNLCQDLGAKILFVGIVCELIVMLIIGLEGFRYLHRKKYVNMDLSLPVTHKQRFFGDLLAVATAQFVPLLISCGIGLAMTAHVRSLDCSYFFPNGITPSYIPYCRNVELGAPMLLAGSVMLLAMSVFVISFCGRTPVALIMTVLVQAAVPITTGCLWVIGLTGAYGANVDSMLDTSFTSLLSPIGFAVSFGAGEWHRLLNASPWGYIFIAAYTAALIAGAYFVQKHRRAERTGEPFVYKYARHGFTALFILAITAFIGLRLFAPEFARYSSFYYIFSGVYSYDNNMAVCVICAVAAVAVFVTMEIIGGGKLKNAPLAAVRFIVTVGACLGVCLIMPLTGCFGYVTYIPSASEVTDVKLTFRNHYDSISNVSVSYEQASALHKRILADHPDGGPAKFSYYPSLGVELTYMNDTAMIASRSYELDESYVRELYDLCLGSGGFYASERMREDGKYTRRNENGQWVTGEVWPTSTYAFVYTTNYLPADETDREKYMIKADVDVYELYDLIIEEAKTVTFEQAYLSPYRQPRTVILRRIYSGSSYPDSSSTTGSYTHDTTVRIYPFYTKTVAMLKEHGLDLFPDAEPDYSGYSAYLIKIRPDSKTGSVENVNSMYSHRCAAAEDASGCAMHRLDTSSDEMKELMSCTAEKSYFTGTERYFIWLTDASYSGQNTGSNMYYVITEENSARAAEIYTSAPEAREELDNLRDHNSIFSLAEIEEYGRKMPDRQ